MRSLRLSALASTQRQGAPTILGGPGLPGGRRRRFETKPRRWVQPLNTAVCDRTMPFHDERRNRGSTGSYHRPGAQAACQRQWVKRPHYISNAQAKDGASRGSRLSSR